MQDGEVQSAQTPVLVHGVSAPTRRAFGGAAWVWMHSIHSSNSGAHFVHACKNDYIGRTMGNAGNAVAGTVDVYQFSVLCEGIGTCKKIVGTNNFTIKSTGFFWSFGISTVNKVIVSCAEYIADTRFLHGFCTAPCNGRAFRNEGEYEIFRFFFRGAVKSFHISFFKFFNDGFRSQSVTAFDK